MCTCMSDLQQQLGVVLCAIDIVYMLVFVSYRVFKKKTGLCFISLYLWQFINIWTGNTLMVCYKLSLSSDMLVKAYSKPRVYYQSIRL